MFIVSIIMPQLSVVSRDLTLYISALIGHNVGHRIASISRIGGIFIFTVAAQFTLHLIFASPAARAF